MKVQLAKKILYALALAMGMSGALLTAIADQFVTMLMGIGISCLAAAGLGEDISKS